jgi:hypothetical protein
MVLQYLGSFGVNQVLAFLLNKKDIYYLPLCDMGLVCDE